MWGRVVVCLLMASLASCSASVGTDSTATTDAAAVSQSAGDKSIHPIEQGTLPSESAPFDFVNASVHGDHLHVDVEYSGGCEDHTFKFYWGGQFLEESAAMVEILVRHDDQFDTCERLVSETLTVDLLQIKSAYFETHSQDAFREISIAVTGLGGKRKHVKYRL